jgi:hypothetical protein
MGGGTVRSANDPLKKALTHALAIWAILAPAWVVVVAARNDKLKHPALDFHYAFLPAAHAVLHGASPYSAIGSRALAQGTAYLYPPLSAYLLAPFTLIPPVAADAIAIVLVLAAVPATLLLLGVRDWRCHAIGLLWWPTIIGIQTANLTLPMLLVVALIWRYRDRRLVAALVTGFLVALKLIFWPVLIWLVATRRYRTAAIAAAASAFFVVVPWAGIGFAGLRGYPHLLATVSRHEGPGSYSVASLLHGVFLSWSTATLVESLLGVALLVVVLVLGRRGRERDAFAISLVSILVLSPLLEMHYIAMLLVIVALYRRTFGFVWVLPLLIWGAPASNTASLPQVVHVLVVVVAAVAFAFWAWEPKALFRALRPERRKPADPAPLSY